MALSISYSNIPHAFGHIMELSQLPTNSTYDVIFNNKTIDQVVDTPTTEYDEMDWFEGDDMLGDPDALDKVKYQAENPNAIMTPWGPTLTPEAVDAIISDSPGVQELLGLTDEEIEEVTASADAIINASGDNLDSIIDQANTTAMSENLDPNDVAVGIVDYMANQPAPGQNDQGGSWLDDAPLSTSNWFSSASEAADDYTPTEENDQGSSWFETSPLSPLNWFVSTAEAADDDKEKLDNYLTQPRDKQYWEERFTKYDGSKEGATNEYLDELLDLSDSDIFSEIEDSMWNDGLSWRYIWGWVQSHPEWSSKTSPRYNLGQALLVLGSENDTVLAAEEGWTSEQWNNVFRESVEKARDIISTGTVQDESQLTTISDTGTVQPTMISDVEDSGALNTQEQSSLMKGEFIEALNKQPHPQYKGYTFGGLLTEKQKLDRYNEANVVFWLDRENTDGSSETIASEFATFLNKYWNDPEAHAEYTDRAKLLEKAQKLALYFDESVDAQIGEEDVGGTYSSYADTYFGKEEIGIGFSPSSNRRILLKLIRSGRSFGDHPGNRYIDSKMDYDNRWGKDWKVSFSDIVDMMPPPTPRTQTQQLEDTLDKDNYYATEVDGMSGPMSVYGPEYYGTGKPFGISDITMGMLRPEPVGQGELGSDQLDKDDIDYYGTGNPFGVSDMTMEMLRPEPVEEGGLVSNQLGEDYTDYYGTGFPFGIPDMTLGMSGFGLSPPTTYVAPGDRGLGSYYDQFQPTDAVKQVPVEDWWAGSQEIDFTDPATRAAASNLQGIEAPAFEDLSTEMLLSMPEAFDDEENKKRMAGRPYSTVLKIGGVIQRNEAGDPIRGTNFVPTNRWVPSR